MAQKLRCDHRRGGSLFAGRQRGYALLFIAQRFGLCSKNLAQTFFAGAEPAAPDEDGRRLDASGRRDSNARGANLVSAHRTRWAAYAERSSRTEFVQPPSAVLLTFLGHSSEFMKTADCLSPSD